MLLHVITHCPARWGGGSVEETKGDGFYFPIKQDQTEQKNY